MNLYRTFYMFFKNCQAKILAIKDQLNFSFAFLSDCMSLSGSQYFSI